MVVQVLGISGSAIPNSNTGINNLGSMVLLGNVPCIRCGYGDQCELSGIKMIHGPGATVESAGVRAFDQDESLQETARKLSEKIRQAVLHEPG